MQQKKHLVIPVDVQRLINSFNDKLPPITIMRKGPELNLWNASVRTAYFPTFQKSEHARKMKLAWLASGNTGLISYLEPFIANRKKMETIRQVILAIK